MPDRPEVLDVVGRRVQSRRAARSVFGAKADAAKTLLGEVGNGDGATVQVALPGGGDRENWIYVRGVGDDNRVYEVKVLGTGLPSYDDVVLFEPVWARGNKYYVMVGYVSGAGLPVADHVHSGGPHTGLVAGDEVDDYSTNVAEMQTTVDPYPAAVESLATSNDGELARLRYLIAQITGEAQWYIDPDSDIATEHAMLLDHSARHEDGGADEISIAGLDHNTLDNLAVGDVHTQYVKESEFTAKGDLIVGTGAGTLDNLLAGADGEFLKANSATGTGLEWDACDSGGAGFMPFWEFRGALAVATPAGVPVRMPYAGSVAAVMLLVATQGTANSTIIDVNKNGVTIFTTQANRPEVAFDDGDDYDVQVPDVTAFNQYDEFETDFDAVATDSEDAWVLVIVALEAGQVTVEVYEDDVKIANVRSINIEGGGDRVVDEGGGEVTIKLGDPVLKTQVFS